MRSYALFLLSIFPLLGVFVLAWVLPGQSFARRYRRAREKTSAMSETADLQRQRNEESVVRLDASRRRFGGEES